VRPILKTPEAFIHNGSAQFGIYEKPFAEMNILDVPVFGKTGALGKKWRRLRLKEWQHWVLIHPEISVSVAVVSAKFIDVTWCAIFDRAGRQVQEASHDLFPGSVHVAKEVYDDCCRVSKKGYAIDIINLLKDSRHEIRIDIAERPGFPAVKGQLVARESLDEVSPLVAALPFASGLPFYSHKVPCPLEGQLTIGGREYHFDRTTCIALLDEHKAYYPYKTFWKWATFAYRDKGERIIGVNLTHNVIPESDKWNENAIWIGKDISLVGPARFSIPKNPMEQWRIDTEDGNVALIFTPLGLRKKDTNLLLSRSCYVMAFGHFSGRLTDKEDKSHEIKDAFGLTEDHLARW
jgi:hypothetical protein